MSFSFSRHQVVFESVGAAEVYLAGLMEQRARSDARLVRLERAYQTWEAERDELERMIDETRLCIGVKRHG